MESRTHSLFRASDKHVCTQSGLTTYAWPTSSSIFYCPISRSYFTWDFPYHCARTQVALPTARPQNATPQGMQCLMVGKQLNTFYYYYFRTEICSSCETFEIRKIWDCRIHLNGPRAAHTVEGKDLRRMGPRSVLTWTKWGSARPSTGCCTSARAIPDMSTGCEFNSLTAALWRGSWGGGLDGQKAGHGPSAEGQLYNSGLGHIQRGRWLSPSVLPLRPHLAYGDQHKMWCC